MALVAVLDQGRANMRFEIVEVFGRNLLRHGALGEKQEGGEREQGRFESVDKLLHGEGEGFLNHGEENTGFREEFCLWDESVVLRDESAGKGEKSIRRQLGNKERVPFDRMGILLASRLYVHLPLSFERRSFILDGSTPPTLGRAYRGLPGYLVDCPGCARWR